MNMMNLLLTIATIGTMSVTAFDGINVMTNDYLLETGNTVSAAFREAAGIEYTTDTVPATSTVPAVFDSIALLADSFNFIDQVMNMVDHTADDMIYELNYVWDEQCGTDFTVTETRDYTFRNAANAIKSQGIMGADGLDVAAVKGILSDQLGISDDMTLKDAGGRIYDWFDRTTSGAMDTAKNDINGLLGE